MKRFSMHGPTILTLGLGLTFLTGCRPAPDGGAGPTTGASPGTAGAPVAASGAGLAGTVRIDGSSTVFPITEAVAEEFGKVEPQVRVTVGISGTGGGFEKFIAGEIDVADASRPIKPAEMEQAKAAGIRYVEVPVAYDGITVVVHPSNTFVDQLTVEELRKIWQPGSTVQHWSDVRPGWPRTPIRLYGPGADSGTFDYFTEVINGKSQASRQDYTASEDDNVLVQGVRGDEGALGYFGFAYYVENRDRIRAVPVEGPDGVVTPSTATILAGTYRPLSRPLFLYIREDAASRPEVEAFMEFYLAQVPALAGEVGYVPLPENVYQMVRKRFGRRVTGSAFAGKPTGGLTLEQILHASD